MSQWDAIDSKQPIRSHAAALAASNGLNQYSSSLVLVTFAFVSLLPVCMVRVACVIIVQFKF